MHRHYKSKAIFLKYGKEINKQWKKKHTLKGCLDEKMTSRQLVIWRNEVKILRVENCLDTKPTTHDGHAKKIIRTINHTRRHKELEPSTFARNLLASFSLLFCCVGNKGQSNKKTQRIGTFYLHEEPPHIFFFISLFPG